jgi:hypothetical protein
MHLIRQISKKIYYSIKCQIALKAAGSSPVEVIFLNLPNLSSRIMAPGSTEPLTEMCTRNLPGGKGRPVRKADNLTAIFEPSQLSRKCGSLDV